MPITSVQKTALEEVITAIVTMPGSPRKRQLSAMFMELVDRTEWPQYYEVIPEPRCLNNIRSGVEKGRYKDAMDVYTDLSLVFWNAIFYNEGDSQISTDAQTLKGVLETEWKKKSVLPPIPRNSPPPSSPQKVHKTTTETMQNAPQVNVQPPTPARSTLPPAQNTSTNNQYTYTKPVAIRPKAAHRQSSMDMDVDISGISPEPEGESSNMERDFEGEEIVRQLEKSLPRWPGFGEEGWMDEVSSDQLLEIIHAIKTHKDVIGNRVAVALEAVPEESTIPNLSYTFPLSLKSIETRVRAKDYTTAKDIDLTMAQLFEKARRWHTPGTEAYGRVLLLQRLYQAITSPSPPVGPTFTSQTNFASVRAGPGNVKPVHSADGDGIAGVTTHRVLVKDRTFVDELHYKGWSIKLADWLHLSNPDDPSRPIIGQVFRCWLSDEPAIKGQPGISVSWYYRPEQTFHPATRSFWEGEVFKTSHFADHSLEDIIEKIACQFTARHIRGRPRAPFWYVGFPLYVCDSRYNDRDRVSVKIKNWNSCVPEEVRQNTEFMPIYPFERTVFPARHPSPFLIKGGKGAVKGPGGLVDSVEPVVEEKEEGPINGRKRTRRNPGGDVGPAKRVHATAGSANLVHQPQRTGAADKSIITALGGLSALGNNAQIEKLPTETTKHFDRDQETGEVLWFGAPPMNVARPVPPQHSIAYLHFLATRRKYADEDEEPTRRLELASVPPTVTETLRAVLDSRSKEG